ncbi:MAG: hypothetical protein KDK91_33610 [Gammaproteobacteria bacterium]|nr:hypothetical protein [Gammaproteobacteria bacterium]
MDLVGGTVEPLDCISTEALGVLGHMPPDSAGSTVVVVLQASLMGNACEGEARWASPIDFTGGADPGVDQER